MTGFYESNTGFIGLNEILHQPKHNQRPEHRVPRVTNFCSQVSYNIFHNVYHVYWNCDYPNRMEKTVSNLSEQKSSMLSQLIPSNIFLNMMLSFIYTLISSLSAGEKGCWPFESAKAVCEEDPAMHQCNTCIFLLWNLLRLNGCWKGYFWPTFDPFNQNLNFLFLLFYSTSM